MTDQKPNRLFGSNPLTTVAIVIYFGVGYGLIKNFCPTLTLGFGFWLRSEWLVTFLFCGDSGTSVKGPRFRIKSPVSAGLSFRAEDLVGRLG